ncbi:MAG: 5 protein [Patescibacteria group bacterium]|nr:5 protein [Patescibacteria group bacterium]
MAHWTRYLSPTTRATAVCTRINIDKIKQKKYNRTIMSTMECLETNECRKNCNVLRMLDVAQRSSMPTAELTADGNDCAYADTLQLGTFEPTLFSNSDLATNVAASLERVLRTGNEVRGAIGQVGNELHVALSERSKIDMALGTLWQQYVEASRSDRKLTDVEVNYFSTELAKQAQSSADVIANLGVGQETITFAQAILDARSLESMGLVLDSGMSRTVTELFANANSGQSTLLVGDKGIAKTLAAKYVSAAFAPNGRPRFISGDGSLMKDEFIGKVELSVEDGATKTVFREGVLVECMEQGIPLVLDEVNLIDPAIAMRLQDILLRKPGDVITLQEDGGRPITIKRGFTVFATANEASERYQARAILDPAFRDRFDTLPIEYPDGGTDILDSTVTPEALTRLAYATIISPDGIANPRVSADDAL